MIFLCSLFPTWYIWTCCYCASTFASHMDADGPFHWSKPDVRWRQTPGQPWKTWCSQNWTVGM